MSKRSIKKAVKIIITVLVVLSLGHFAMTGSPFPIFKIEKLDDPIEVTGWSPQGLMLEDGRIKQLPGFTQLPDQSVALTNATLRGIEVTPEDRVIGLMPIWHWCGNDPVRKHIVRVDLAMMLMYLGEGQYELPDTNLDKEFFEIYRPEKFQYRKKSGWNQSQYHQFQRWEHTVVNSEIR